MNYISKVLKWEENKRRKDVSETDLVINAINKS